MALRNIVQDGDPVLKKESRAVTKYDGRLCQLLDDMRETLAEADGMGLAAPQVGVLRRAFIVLDEPERPEDKGADGEGAEAATETEKNGEDANESGEAPEGCEPVFIEFINPEILEREGEVRGYEGCLSFPGRYAAIGRPTRVRVRAQDRNGETFEYEATGMMARCLCHETDHLNGVTIDQLAEYFYDPEHPHDLDEEYEEDREQEKGGL